MTSALTEAIESNKTKSPGKDKLDKKRGLQREKVIEILSQPLLPFEQEKVYAELADYVRFYFGYELVGKYPNISPGIFNLKNKRKLEVDGDYYSKGAYEVVLPTVVKIPFKEANQGYYRMRQGGNKVGRDGERKDLDLSCAIPEITPEARIAYADSVRFSAQVVANGFKDDIVSKILLRDLNHERKILTPLDSQYFLIWAPTEWHVKPVPRVERDPAIIMEYNIWSFLVYQWETPEERSLDAMLREFREVL